MAVQHLAVAVDRPGPNAVSAIPADLYLPASGHGPGLVLVQEIFGRTAYLQGRATQLAEAGYVVVLPQLYWRIGEDVIEESEPESLERAIALSMSADFDEVAADVRSCVAFLRSEQSTADRVGVIGFCYGGGVAYAAASGAIGEQRPDVLVSYYGSALPQLVDAVPAVTVPSLHHFGDADAYLAADAVAHITEVITEPGQCTVLTWPGAGHAFDNPAEAFHHAQASAGAWRETLAWLTEHLPVDQVA